jgi:hypothetical protein
MLFWHFTLLAESWAILITGISSAAIMAIIVTTTNSSMSENARCMT